MNVVDYEMCTPLHHALKRQDTKTAQLLLAHGASPWAADYRKQTLLHYVSKYNCAGIAR